MTDNSQEMAVTAWLAPEMPSDLAVFLGELAGIRHGDWLPTKPEWKREAKVRSDNAC